MAIYYMNVQVIGRSAGRTATGAAAYRAAERIVDERTGRVFDYTRRRGEIEAEILAPANAPTWVQNRAQLWNQVEAAERRADAQVAREFVVAIPLELDREAQRELVRRYVQQQFVSQGMVADAAIHRNPGNPHAHIMLTMREIGPEGFAAKKNREWNKPEALERWREGWALETNRVLERAGRDERIDHRRLEEQGLDRLPQIHLGPHVAALERQGVTTEKGDHNRLVVEHNAIVIDLERARKERHLLRVEHAAQARFDTRIQSGWRPDEAKAIASLEADAGGRRLSRPEITQRRDECWHRIEDLDKEIRTIEDGGTRLRQAEWALDRHAETLRDLRRHENPIGAIRRLLSDDARRSYRDAQYQAKTTRDRVCKVGIATVAQLDRERAEWEQQAKRVPDLKATQGVFMELMDVLTKALKGFEREQSREYDDWLRQSRRREQERARDRGSDRDR